MIELMVVVALIAVISSIGYITLGSRMRLSRLESSAQELASNLSYARTAALFKNTPTRIVFCMDPTCATRAVAATTTINGQNVVGNGTLPARYYAILRMAEYFDPNGVGYIPDTDGNLANCDDPSPGVFDPTATIVSPCAGGGGYWNYWDFDRKPQRIPDQIVFKQIYASNIVGLSGNSGVADNTDGGSDWGSSGTNSDASIWFPTSSSVPVGTVTHRNIPGNSPVDNSVANAGLGNDASGRPRGVAFFQLGLESCNPAVEDDCVAYIVGLGEAGKQAVYKCSKPAGGNRSADSLDCF